MSRSNFSYLNYGNYRFSTSTIDLDAVYVHAVTNGVKYVLNTYYCTYEYFSQTFAS